MTINTTIMLLGALISTGTEDSAPGALRDMPAISWMGGIAGPQIPFERSFSLAPDKTGAPARIELFAGVPNAHSFDRLHQRFMQTGAATIGKGPTSGISGISGVSNKSGIGPAHQDVLWGEQTLVASELARYIGNFGALDGKLWHPLQTAIRRDLRGLIDAFAADDAAPEQPEFSCGPGPHRGSVALQALSAARALMLPVESSLMEAIGTCVLDAVDDSGRVVAVDPNWWPGPAEDHTRALTALLFFSLANAGEDAVAPKYSERFEAMHKAVRGSINLSIDPFAIAYAGLGLLAYGAHFNAMEFSLPRARRAMRRVAEAQDEGVWSPAWHRSPRATLQTSAAALVLLAAPQLRSAGPLDPQITRALVAMWAIYRGAVDFPLAAESTSLLRVHNAFPEATTPTSSPGYTLEVVVNGATQGSHRFGPAKGRKRYLIGWRIDLSEAVHDGDNHIRVRRDGRSDAGNKTWIWVGASRVLGNAATVQAPSTSP